MTCYSIDGLCRLLRGGQPERARLRKFVKLGSDGSPPTSQDPTAAQAKAGNKEKNASSGYGGRRLSWLSPVRCFAGGRAFRRLRGQPSNWPSLEPGAPGE